MASENTHYLVLSSNSVLKANPVHGSYEEEGAAQNVVEALTEVEKNRLEVIWGSKWTLFASKFYVEPVAVNTPVEDVLASFTR